jgi:hypothetical protein
MPTNISGIKTSSISLDNFDILCVNDSDLEHVGDASDGQHGHFLVSHSHVFTIKSIMTFYFLSFTQRKTFI